MSTGIQNRRAFALRPGDEIVDGDARLNWRAKVAIVEPVTTGERARRVIVTFVDGLLAVYDYDEVLTIDRKEACSHG